MCDIEKAYNSTNPKHIVEMINKSIDCFYLFKESYLNIKIKEFLIHFFLLFNGFGDRLVGSSYFIDTLAELFYYSLISKFTIKHIFMDDFIILRDHFEDCVKLLSEYGLRINLKKIQVIDKTTKEIKYLNEKILFYYTYSVATPP